MRPFDTPTPPSPRYGSIISGRLAGWICSAAFASASTLHAAAPVPTEIIPERISGAKPRNVVFILSDDHRYDAMSFLAACRT